MQKSFVEARRHFYVLYGLSFVLGVAFTVAGVISIRAAFSLDDNRALPPAAVSKTALHSNGPWGRLEYEEIALEESSQVFADRAERIQPPHWVFKGYSRQQLTELLESCQLDDAEKAFLLDTSHWEPLSDGFAISPPDQIVLGLSATSRQRLYWSLATNSANYPQNLPFNFLSSSVEDRFADSGLGADKIELISKLAYQGYGCRWLAVDRPLLQSLDTNELQSFVHVLYSYPAWMLRVRVTPDSDVDALVKYWGKGREKKLRPFLESLAASPKGRTIDVGALLPPFAQEHLYTFPDPESEPAVEHEDCFYSAMNFFNEQPDPGFLNVAYTRKILASDYVVTQSPAKFGDVVVLLDPAGNGIHACVYLADNFVFTKNGGSEQPWLIMKLCDVLASYPSGEHQRVVSWRHKSS